MQGTGNYIDDTIQSIQNQVQIEKKHLLFLKKVLQYTRYFSYNRKRT